MNQVTTLAPAVKKTPRILLLFVPLEHLNFEQGKSNREGAWGGNKRPLASPFGTISCEVNAVKAWPVGSYIHFHHQPPDSKSFGFCLCLVSQHENLRVQRFYIAPLTHSMLQFLKWSEKCPEHFYPINSCALKAFLHLFHSTHLHQNKETLLVLLFKFYYSSHFCSVHLDY